MSFEASHDEIRVGKSNEKSILLEIVKVLMTVAICSGSFDTKLNLD
jgi:hypothetical protein